MIYNTYTQLKKAIEEKIKCKVSNKVWGIYTSFSCFNFHPPFDDEDLTLIAPAIKKMMENMPQR